jgi:hypothetical protein
MVKTKKSISDYIKEELENVDVTESDIIDLKNDLILSLRKKNS